MVQIVCISNPHPNAALSFRLKFLRWGLGKNFFPKVLPQYLFLLQICLGVVEKTAAEHDVLHAAAEFALYGECRTLRYILYGDFAAVFDGRTDVRKFQNIALCYGIVIRAFLIF